MKARKQPKRTGNKLKRWSALSLRRMRWRSSRWEMLRNGSGVNTSSGATMIAFEAWMHRRVRCSIGCTLAKLVLPQLTPQRQQSLH